QIGVGARKQSRLGSEFVLPLDREKWEPGAPARFSGCPVFGSQVSFPWQISISPLLLFFRLLMTLRQPYSFSPQSDSSPNYDLARGFGLTSGFVRAGLALIRLGESATFN